MVAANESSEPVTKSKRGATLLLDLDIGKRPKRIRGTTSRKALRQAVIARQEGKCMSCERVCERLHVLTVRRGVRAAYCPKCHHGRAAQGRTTRLRR